MPSTWPFPVYMYCSSHFRIAHTFIMFKMWDLGMWLHIQIDTCTLHFDTSPHIYHTYFLDLPLLICCYKFGRLQVAISSSYIWNMYKMVYCTKLQCILGAIAHWSKLACFQNVASGNVVVEVKLKDKPSILYIATPISRHTHACTTITSCPITCGLPATGLVDFR